MEGARLVEEREEEKKKKEKDAEQFSMPYGGTSNWRIDTERKIRQKKKKIKDIMQQK